MSYKSLLHKYAIIETVVDELENLRQMEHSPRRIPDGFIVNLIPGLIA
jgi:hypothetical protein